MKLMLSIMVGVLFAATMASATPLPGIQVVACYEEPPGVWHYDYFTCTGDFEANDLHIQLHPDEIDEGTVIMGCSVPDEPGYTCSYTATQADYTFPTVGTYECVPGLSGQYLGISIQTDDEFTRVLEIWTLDGEVVGQFNTSITCPPVPVDESDWSSVKSMYR